MRVLVVTIILFVFAVCLAADPPFDRPTPPPSSVVLEGNDDTEKKSVPVRGAAEAAPATADPNPIRFDVLGDQKEPWFDTVDEDGKTVLMSRVPVSFTFDGDRDVTLGRADGRAVLPIDYQLGQRLDDDIYLRFFVTPDHAPETLATLQEAFKPFSDELMSAGVITAQCPGPSVCVKRCKKSDGSTFCCEWKCTE